MAEQPMGVASTQTEPVEDPLKRLNQPFDEMFSAEIRGWVCKHREYRSRESSFPSPDHPDPRNGLVGLAMSGGGMRSGTFNLGVAQALAQYGLMDHVDYISTVSGGGYLGSSLTSLCWEDLPYPAQPSGDERTRLNMTKDRFPYAFPGPLSQPSGESRASPDVHGLESPATRHVREFSRLLLPAAGIFQMEAWTTISRYLLSTIALWVLFLLPMASAVLLPTILIPDGVWDRAAPFAVGQQESNFSLASNPWLIMVPVAILGLAALLALFPGRDRRRSDEFGDTLVRWLQKLAIIGSVVAAGAVLFVFTLWGLTELLRLVPQWGFSLIGGGGAAAAFGSLRYGPLQVDVGGLLSRSEKIRKVLWSVAFAISGYLVLGVGLVTWYYFLWNGWVRLWGWQGFKQSLDGYWIAWVAVAAVLALSWALAPWLLNTLSLNRLYEQRLQRTWLIAATPGRSREARGVRWPERGWGRIWVRPDMKVGDIATAQVEGWQPSSPYPLVCTTLNLSGSTGPQLLNRKADSFVIGPVYTGSALTRWRPTEGLRVFRDMSLARAAAISAAAFSPNMGRRTNTTLSIATTLFNARLGWWVRNPYPHGWIARWIWPPPFLLYWREMLGMASHKQAMVYLSDGGHFENLGLYELLRRRCKYIIAVDGTGEPPEKQPLTFDALGVALRRARIDFGVLVDIDLRPMMRDSETGHVKSYFAVGAIRYPKQDGHGGADPGDEDSGILVFIKGGIVEESIPPDIINYHRGVNPSFPHDPTADQQFDEPQFESYRELGFLAGQAVSRSTAQDQDTASRFAKLASSYQDLLKERDST